MFVHRYFRFFIHSYFIIYRNVRAWIKKYGKIKTSTGQITSNDEILKLQKENQEIKTENEILKKALAIFSRQQKIK